MLEIARERARSLGLSNIEFHQSDAEMLTIPDRDFDAVLCRWGLMFMPDLPKALREIRIRMRVGARFATAVWATADKVPLIGIAQDIVRQLANLPPPPPNALEPTRLADTSILKSGLEQTGFKEVQIERRNVVFEFESPEAFTRFRQEIAAPFRGLLERQTSEMRARIIEGVTSAARKFAGPDGKVRTSNETILFVASA
jgi:SAM-dependent methyltransferase